MSRSPKSKGHTGQGEFFESGKRFGRLQPFRMLLRGGVCVLSGCAAVCVFAWVRLGVINAQKKVIGRWDVTV